MKKVIAILAIAIVLIGAAFAATNDQLLITCEVEAVHPIYAMYGDLSAYPTISNNAHTGTLASTTLSSSTLTGGNIATQDGGIDVYVTVFQTNDARYLKTAGVEVKVIASVLAQVTDSTTNPHTYSATYKVDPSVAESAAGQSTATTDFDNTTTPAALTGLSNNSVGVKFLPKYKTGAKVDANTIGTVKFNWPKTDTLPAGTYEAPITLQYTTN